MTLPRIPLIALVMMLTCVSKLGAQQGLLDAVTSNINIEGLETTFDPDTGIATAIGNVHIKYGDTEITAGRADYNANTGDVMAKEDVTVWKAGITYKGENLIYNIKTNELTGNTIRSGMAHGVGNVFYTTDKFETETKFIDRIDGKQTFMTTHDYASPNFQVKAREITIYPGDRIIMKRITVYSGKTPVFWFPYLVQPLDDEVGYKFVPGYSNLWGAFLLNQYGVIHGDHTLAKYHFDLRSARGVAGGADFISLRHKDNQDNFGTLKFYVAGDSDGSVTTGAGTRADQVDSTRYRVNFQHRIYLPGPEKSTWYMDFDINKMSDIHFYEDYFFEEFRTNREPDNQVSLIHTDPRYTATLMGRFQLNDFYRTDTRLPELAVDFTRQSLGNSGVFYQGSTSIGILKDELSNAEKDKINAEIDSLTNPVVAADGTMTSSLALSDAEIRKQLDALRASVDGPGFTRFHTYNEFLYPKTLGGWLNVVPRVGGGVTYYGDVSGSSDGTSSEAKGIFHAGVDVSFKASKTWDDVQNEALGLNGLRHVVRPYINYSYLNTDDPAGVPSIDRLSPTTRARTIDVPLFTAVDDLRSWNVARLGVQNLFQTKRDYQSYDSSQARFRSSGVADVQSYNWAGINSYVDLFAEDPEYDRSISNLYNEVFWRPLPWLTFFSDTQLPVGNSEYNFTELNHGVTWLPTNKLSVTLNHQFVTDHPFVEESSRIASTIYARMTENWGFSMNHVYEIDDGTLQYQSYSLHRDLSSWVMSFGARVLDSVGGEGDYGLVLSFTLKDFPQVSIPLDGAQGAMGGNGGF
jgi:LPS-assembly protein